MRLPTADCRLTSPSRASLSAFALAHSTGAPPAPIEQFTLHPDRRGRRALRGLVLLPRPRPGPRPAPAPPLGARPAGQRAANPAADRHKIGAERPNADPAGDRNPNKAA